LLIAAGTIAAASALPASAHVYWTFGFGISYPGVYAGYGWPAPAYYPPPYRHWYPGYYPYPRYYGYPAYVPRYYAARPAARVVASGQRRANEPLAAIPPQRFEKVTLSAKELFAFDEYQIQGSQPKLDEIAKALKENPNIASVTITGYTDRLGTDDYNLALSKRRAESVQLYLMRMGVDRSRLTVVGKGEADAVVKCDEKDQQALIKCLEPNRRVEITPFTIEKKTGPIS
jgi:outer membrane protein OmpA-like peptidoglycan-associated protein